MRPLHKYIAESRGLVFINLQQINDAWIDAVDDIYFASDWIISFDKNCIEVNIPIDGWKTDRCIACLFSPIDNRLSWYFFSPYDDISSADIKILRVQRLKNRKMIDDIIDIICNIINTIKYDYNYQKIAREYL